MTTTDTNSPVVLNANWIEGAQVLSKEAGWNQTAEDWKLFFTHGTVFGIVIEDRLVATAAALPYGDKLGWISMVLVTTEWRRRGLAARLVAACISILRDSGRAALLDAAPAGLNIYTSLGFVPLCEMQRWEGEGRGHNDVTTSTSNVLDEIAAQDSVVFGADRRFLLEDFSSRPGTSVFQTAKAYAILRQGSNASQLGPLIGESEPASALMLEAIQTSSGRIVVDVLDAGRKILPKLAAQGFQQRRSFTRMALGLGTLPGDPARVLAAAGPEFG